MHACEFALKETVHDADCTHETLPANVSELHQALSPPKPCKQSAESIEHALASRHIMTSYDMERRTNPADT